MDQAKDTEKDKDVPQIAHKNPTSRTNLAESPYAKVPLKALYRMITSRAALMSGVTRLRLVSLFLSRKDSFTVKRIHFKQLAEAL